MTAVVATLSLWASLFFIPADDSWTTFAHRISGARSPFAARLTEIFCRYLTSQRKLTLEDQSRIASADTLRDVIEQRIGKSIFDVGADMFQSFDTATDPSSAPARWIPRTSDGFVFFVRPGSEAERDLALVMSEAARCRDGISGRLHITQVVKNRSAALASKAPAELRDQIADGGAGRIAVYLHARRRDDADGSIPRQTYGIARFGATVDSNRMPRLTAEIHVLYFNAFSVLILQHEIAHVVALLAAFDERLLQTPLKEPSELAARFKQGHRMPAPFVMEGIADYGFYYTGLYADWNLIGPPGALARALAEQKRLPRLHTLLTAPAAAHAHDRKITALAAATLVEFLRDTYGPSRVQHWLFSPWADASKHFETHFGVSIADADAAWTTWLLRHQIGADASSRRAAVERSLIPRVAFTGEPRMDLVARMAHYGVPGVSIAVWKDGTLDWAQAYGVRGVTDPQAVASDTLFQAGSVSKSIAAAVILRVASRMGVALSTPVNSLLSSWKLPAGDGVTLERILSHTAGLNVPGFPGYERGEPLPSILQELDGAPPALTQPLRVVTPPGQSMNYSGGGYLLLQHVLQELTAKPFAALAREEVLQRAGMSNSTFEQPLASSLMSRASLGLTEEKAIVRAGERIYPEQAAAGLWTTAADLARFAMAVQDAAGGRSERVLSQSAALRMISPAEGTGEAAGLGTFLVTRGNARYFTHGGGNAGFVAAFVAHATERYGAAVLTNAENSEELVFEIFRAVAAIYEWDSYLPTSYTRAHLDPQQLERFAGRYKVDDDDILTVSVVSDQLRASHTLGPDIRLECIGPATFVRRDRDEQWTFTGSGVKIRDATFARTSDERTPTEMLVHGRERDALRSLRRLDGRLLAEPRLRTRGEELLRRGRRQRALALLGLNTSLHPRSAAAWDALLRAQLAAGRRTAAALSARAVLNALNTDWTATASWRVVFRKRAEAILNK